MDNIFYALIHVVLGMVLGFWLSFCHIVDRYWKPMDALGIEKFQKCEINTTNCHSNWYEIVYKEKNM